MTHVIYQAPSVIRPVTHTAVQVHRLCQNKPFLWKNCNTATANLMSPYLTRGTYFKQALNLINNEGFLRLSDLKLQLLAVASVQPSSLVDTIKGCVWLSDLSHPLRFVNYSQGLQMPKHYRCGTPD